MKSFYRQVIAVFLASILIHVPYKVMAAEWEIVSWDGTGNYDNTKQWRIVEPTEGTTYGHLLPGTDNANNIGNTSYRAATIYTYDLDIADDVTVASTQQFGSATVAVSSLSTSGLSYGTIFTATLGGSTAAIEGHALCALAPTGSTVLVQVCAATDNLVSFVGIAAAAASTGSVVNVYDSGWVLARTTMTLVAGGGLMTSANAAGHLQSTTVSSNSVVGVSLATGTATGGLTRIKLN